MQNQFSGFSVANAVSSVILLALLGVIALLIVQTDINPQLEPFTARPTSSQVYLPLVVGKPPLKAVASRSDVKVGAFTEVGLVDSEREDWLDWLPLATMLSTQFNTITPSRGYFGSIHPCPPRELVDPANNRYVPVIHEVAKAQGACTALQNTNTINWQSYANQSEWNWAIDKAIAWAKTNNVGVYFHTFLFESGEDGVLPRWLQRSSIGQLDQSGRKALLFLMEDHITTIMTRYCHDSTEYNGIPLKNVVYAYDVVNEATLNTGGLRQDVIWAQINELVREGSEFYDPNHDTFYQDPELEADPDMYYIYKAFQYAREVAGSPLCQDQEIELIYNDVPALNFFWDDEDAPSNQKWGEGIFYLMEALLDLDSKLDDDLDHKLIDGIGIQAHLNYLPTTPSPASVTAGQRQVLEAFNALGLTVRITELDVSLRKAWTVPFSHEEVAQYFPQQAEIYRDVVHHCLYAADGTYNPICSGITTWGVMDHISWRDYFYPLMFNQGHPLKHTSSIRPVERSKYFFNPDGPAPKAIVPKPAFFSVYDKFRSAAEATVNHAPEGGYLPPAKAEKPSAYPAPAPAPAAYPRPETKR